MRAAFLLVLSGVIAAQTDPTYEPLTQAYESLNSKNYDAAIEGFKTALGIAPGRASIHKDLGYAYLKIGENDLARAQFLEAMRLDPSDRTVALEYGFLCYERRDKLEARRIFDSLRQEGNPVAQQAFQNIDRPLEDGIARWQEAIAKGADDSGSHLELATLAEQRDNLALAAEQYRLAWQKGPEHRDLLLDLGRVLEEMGRDEEARPVLLAASRSDDARTAEMARERLPQRYPYVSEFRAALDVDPQNVNLRRDLAYLLLEMRRSPEAEKEFRILADPPANDLLSAAQLGFLLYGRGEWTAAKAYLVRVLTGDDENLANRVRAVMGLPQTSVDAPDGDAKEMADNSIRAGYIKDALKYLTLAYDSDPNDMDTVLKMGWAANILHRDHEAFRWFSLARQSSDPAIASVADRDWRNLRAAEESVGISGWMFPMYSTRWHDLFGYGQIRAEFHTHLPIQPYISLRFDGDTRSSPAIPEMLYSQTSVILAAGVRTPTWQGITGWFEAGSSANYLKGHMLPDYRGGISVARAKGRTLEGESTGFFADMNADAVFLSRFDNDFLVYSQSRTGYTVGPSGLRTQLFWGGNLTFDSARQVWANFVETGPGIRVHTSFMPESMYLVVSAMRGTYLMHDDDHRPYTDLKAGMWYAFAR